METATVERTPMPAELSVPLEELDIATIKGELVPVGAENLSAPTEDDPLRVKAREQVSAIISISPNEYEGAKAAIDSAGRTVMEESATQSEMLKNKLGDLMKHSQEGSPVATALIELRDQVSELDPEGVNFSPGGIARVLGALPFVGDPLKRYFNRFETAQGALGDITKSLKNGKNTLLNDNRILGADQERYRQTTLVLQQQIEYLQAVSEEFEIQLQGVNDADHKQFLENEILFPLKQRVQDLLQRLAVNQQGVLSNEILIRTNRELIRGVDRALFVTVDALNIAVATALALTNQEMVLSAVEGVNATTNKLIASNAKRLKTQGADIQKQATSAMLDVDVLKQSFVDLKSALDDLATYRQTALPKISNNVNEMVKMANEAESSIRQMEKGNKMVADIPFTLDLENAEAA